MWNQILSLGTTIEICYLNRAVTFEVVSAEEGKALKVIDSKNSSLQKDDIAYIDRIRKGEKLEARKVCRGNSLGSYRTNGEVRSIDIIERQPE